MAFAGSIYLQARAAGEDLRDIRDLRDLRDLWDVRDVLDVWVGDAMAAA